LWCAREKKQRAERSSSLLFFSYFFFLVATPSRLGVAEVFSRTDQKKL
jgi:hypothetical protein